MTPKAIAPGSLLSLAERVESLDGPDRSIDADIELATGNWTAEHHEAWNRFQECGESANPPIYRPVNPHWFTSSLDAARTLVPADHTIQLSDWEHQDLRKSGPWHASQIEGGLCPDCTGGY